MSKARTKKDIPLSGDSLSTGVLISKATSTQLDMESGRLIKVGMQRIAACKELGTKHEDDDQYCAALDRSKMLLRLCYQRLHEEAKAAGVKIDLPDFPDLPE